jgi:hypothetical protein
MTLEGLRVAGTLSHPPPAGLDYALPGDAVQKAALGYLHANCGNCHYPGSYAEVMHQVDMYLFITAASTAGAVSNLPPWATTVNRPLVHFQQPGGPFFFRVVPGDPGQSAIFHRMSSRGSSAQMPAFGTEITDPTGLSQVMAWIKSL